MAPGSPDLYYPQAKVSRRRLHGEVAHGLGLRIVGGRLAAGEALPNETRLDPAVSRVAWREAVKILEAKGLVESRPRLGTRVAAKGRWNLLDPDVLA
mgnify:CR=1 FL=1